MSAIKPQRDALFKQDEARLMVSGWLKRRLIADFFELFCAGTARRRLDYWLGYASRIDDIWFVLGSNTWVKEEYDFRYKAVRRRTDQSRWLQMSHETKKNNNAFVMRIGNLLVVEFSASDGDSFFFPANPMPFNLGENQPIAESRLKCAAGKKLAHQGNWWENNFDLMLRTAL